MTRSNKGDPDGFLPLNTLEFRVLLVLMDGDLHGYGIAKEIERRDPSLGRIYPTNPYRRLRDMSEHGLLAELPASDNGEQKRLFKLTELGRLVAKKEALRLEALVLDARKHDLLSQRSASS